MKYPLRLKTFPSKTVLGKRQQNFRIPEIIVVLQPDFKCTAVKKCFDRIRITRVAGDSIGLAELLPRQTEWWGLKQPLFLPQFTPELNLD